MRQNKLSVVFVCILLVLGLLQMVPTTTNAQVIEVKASHVYKEENIWAQHVKILGNMVERRTKGRIHFNYYFGGTVFSSYSEQVSAALSGSAQFAHMNTSLLAPYDPRWNVVFSPGVIYGWDHWLAFEKTDAYKALTKYFEEKTGAKILYWGCAVPGGDVLWNRKRPVVTPDDWKGLKIRTSPAEPAILLVKALGGSPVVLSSPETATALSQGVVDGGLVTTSVAVPSWNAQKVAPYCTILDGGRNLGSMQVGIIVNLKFWNSLPADIRKAIEDGIGEAQAETVARTEKVSAEHFELFKNTPGTHVAYLTKEQTKVWTDIIDKQVLSVLEAKYGKDLIEAAKATRPK